MSLPIPTAYTQYLDNDGIPVSGGTVDYYQPGTTTRVNTYQNQALTILNANPV